MLGVAGSVFPAHNILHGPERHQAYTARYHQALSYEISKCDYFKLACSPNEPAFSP
jgi:hypothetical protein